MSAVILHRTDPVKNMRRFTCSLIYLGNSALRAIMGNRVTLFLQIFKERRT
jgi:hypothetical protein